MGLRRVVVTPTFAAGLGVVMAAVIAYPLTKTVISYGREPPAGGHPCRVAGCATTAPDSGGLASAKPGHFVPSRPRHHQAGADGPAASGLRPVMTYRTLQQWPGGFVGQVTITMPTGAMPTSWRLRLSYPSAAIDNVWGGSWAPRGPHVVVVTSGQSDPAWPGSSPSPGAGNIRIFLTVTGPSRAPAGCELNGRPCARG